MKLIDLHCDTLWKLMDLSGNGDLMKNDGCVSIEAMKKGGTMAQFFACFTYADDYKETGGYDAAWQHVLEMIAYLKEQTRIYADQISLATSCQEMRENAGHGKISAVLTVEEGGVLNGHLDRLEELYRQ